MKKRKTLVVTLSGKRYDPFNRILIPVGQVLSYQVTGSRLSIRKVEDQAVSSFMREYSLGFCCCKSEILSVK